MDAIELITLCRGLGATLIPNKDKLRIRSPQPLPADIMAALRQEKMQVIAELERQIQDESTCWFLAEWRRVSIPEWRRVLRECIENHNKQREDYTRWMLREILEDPDCKENHL
jgi:hypothetical protein